VRWVKSEVELRQPGTLEEKVEHILFLTISNLDNMVTFSNGCYLSQALAWSQGN
jgi:hypothetical protein